MATAHTPPHKRVLDLNRADGTDSEYHASAFAECGVHSGAELLYVLGWNECLNSTGKATAVYAPCCALAAQQPLGKAECQRKSLLGNVFGGIHVLEILEA